MLEISHRTAIEIDSFLSGIKNVEKSHTNYVDLDDTIHHN